MSENTNPILYPNWNDRSSKEILKPWRSKSIYSKYFTYWGTVLSPPPLSWASVRLQSWISISVLLTRTSLPWAALDLGSGEHTVLARLFVCGTQAMFSVCFNKWQSRNVSLSNMGGKNSYLLGRGWDGWTASPTQWTWVWANSREMVKDKEDWWAAVHGVTKNQTWLNDWTTTKERTCEYFHIRLENENDPNSGMLLSINQPASISPIWQNNYFA